MAKTSGNITVWFLNGIASYLAFLVIIFRAIHTTKRRHFGGFCSGKVRDVLINVVQG